LAKQLVGDEVVQQGSFVQAHGSSTPQNRVTESRIFDQVARHFGITRWPVGAIKSYVGHSLGPASGDQMINTLGVFAQGILPGIKTIDGVADDVLAERLVICSKDQILGEKGAQVAFLNSKGFGGNNATATVIAPSIVNSWLQKRYSVEQWQSYLAKQALVAECAQAYDEVATKGDLKAIYHFGDNLIDDTQLQWCGDELKLPGFAQGVFLASDGGFDDLKAQ
jgi:acetoacetyl-[acyl-carrier protein] synthase